MTNLTSLEQRVLEAILRGDHPVLDALREQAASCRAAGREWTGAGFYTKLEVPSLASSLRGSARIGGVFADVEGLRDGAGFVVLVEDGRLALLEGFSYDEPWPQTVRSFQVHYRDTEPDLSALATRT